MPEESKYKFPPLEKFINRCINVIFYYRLIFVLLALGVTILIIFWIPPNTDIEGLKNGALMLFITVARNCRHLVFVCPACRR